jgi:hypothetical protein
MPADEQELRFLELDGARVAYATLGSGPALLVPALWIRFDRLGTGLSDRTIDPARIRRCVAPLDNSIRRRSAPAARSGPR